MRRESLLPRALLLGAAVASFADASARDFYWDYWNTVTGTGRNVWTSSTSTAYRYWDADAYSHGGTGTYWVNSSSTVANNAIFEAPPPYYSSKIELGLFSNINAHRVTFKTGFILNNYDDYSGTTSATYANTLGIYQGISTVAGGTVINPNISLLAHNTWDVASGSYLDINGVISDNSTTVGNYNLTKNGGGWLYLYGNNTFDGNLYVNAGGVVIGNGATAGNIKAREVHVAAGAFIDVDRTNAVTLGSSYGSGTISKSGDSALTVGSLGVNAATGVSFGLLGTDSSLCGLVVNQATEGAYLHTGTISGTGYFTKAGARKLRMSGVHTYSGGTRITGGTLQLEGAGQLPVWGDVTMTGTSSLVFSAVQQVGTLTINNATTTISGGTLEVDSIVIGTVAGNSTVNFDVDLAGSAELDIRQFSGYTTTVNLMRSNIDRYGDTILRSGTLLLSSNDALQYSLLDKQGGTLKFNQDGWLNDPYSYNYSIAGLSGDSGFALRTDDVSQTGEVTSAVLLSVTQGFDTTFSGVISGAGGMLDKHGSGRLTLTAANTFTGSLNVSEGSVEIGNGGTTGSIAAPVSVAAGASLIFNRSTDSTHASAINSYGLLVKRGDGVLTLTNDANNTFPGVGIVVEAGGLSGSVGSLYGANIDNRGVVTILTSPTGSEYTDIFGVISGSGRVVNQATNPITVSARQTFTGGLTLSAGSLTLSNHNLLPGDITLAGGDLNLGSFSNAAGNVFLNHENSLIDGTGVLSVTSLQANFTGTTRINVSLAGSGYLTKSNTGTLGLYASNTFTGATSVSGGTLRLYHGNALSMSTLNMVGGAVVFDSTAGTNTFNLGGLASDGSGLGRDINLRNNATSPAAVSLVVGANNQNAVYRGTLSGTGSLTKVGTGTQVLAGGASTFTGGITIQEGILQLGESPANGDALSSSVGFNVSIASGAGLVIKQGAGWYFYAKYSGQGSVTVDGGTWWQGVYGGRQLYTGGTYIRNGGTLRTDHGEQMPYGQAVYLDGGNFDITGYWTYGSGETIGQLSITGSGTSSVVGTGRYLSTTGVVANHSGNASISVNLQGAGGVSKSGSGTLALSGTNSYTGSTSVSAGVLAISGNQALGSGAAGVTVASGAELRMTGASLSGKALSISGSGIGSAGALRASTGVNTWSGAITLAADARINADAGSTLSLSSGTAISGTNRNVTFGGSGGISVTGGIAVGSGGLVKDGAGSLTLAGTSTYTGATTLNAGTLTVNGSIQSSQAVTMAAGTTLGGTGSVAGAVNVGAGASTRLVAGNGTSGTLTVGSLNFLGAATLGIGPVSNYTSSSAFVVNGGISFGGGAGSVALNLAGSSIANGVYRFVTFGSGTVDTSKFSVTGAALSPTQSGLLFLDGNTVTYAVTGHQMVWTGAVNGNWDTQTANWQVNGAATAYSNGQNLLFNDASERRSIEVAPSLAPVALNFDNGSGKDYVIAGSGISSGILHKRGSGKLTVRGSHGFTGGSRIEGGGSVRLGGANALGLGRIELHNGRISSEGSASRSLSNTLAIASDAAALGDASDNGELTFTGDIDLMASSRVLEVASTVKVAGRILGNSLDKRGSGTLAIVANNAYQGGLLLINGGAVSIGAGTSQGSLSSNIVNNATLRFERTDSLTYAGSISGTGAVVVQGGGALTLTGDSSTRTGSTTVSSSQLVVNGVLGGTLALGAGSSLGGSGTVLGNATIAGTHSPGNSPGIQTFGGNLTYQSGASVNWQLVANGDSNSPTVQYDQILVGGNLHFGAVTPLVLDFKDLGSTVDWGNSFWSSNRSWILYQVTGNISGSHRLTLSNTGYEDANGAMLADVRDEAYFRLVRSGGQILLTYSAIPEPSTYGLILGGLALAGAAVRRRKQLAK